MKKTILFLVVAAMIISLVSCGSATKVSVEQIGDAFNLDVKMDGKSFSGEGYDKRITGKAKSAENVSSFEIVLSNIDCEMLMNSDYDDVLNISYKLAVDYGSVKGYELKIISVYLALVDCFEVLGDPIAESFSEELFEKEMELLNGNKIKKDGWTISADMSSSEREVTFRMSK